MNQPAKVKASVHFDKGDDDQATVTKTLEQWLQTADADGNGVIDRDEQAALLQQLRNVELSGSPDEDTEQGSEARPPPWRCLRKRYHDSS